MNNSNSKKWILINTYCFDGVKTEVVGKYDTKEEAEKEAAELTERACNAGVVDKNWDNLIVEDKQ